MEIVFIYNVIQYIPIMLLPNSGGRHSLLKFQIQLLVHTRVYSSPVRTHETFINIFARIAIFLQQSGLRRD